MSSSKSCWSRCLCRPFKCCRCSCFKPTIKNPMAKGEDFITLDEKYLDNFDEIIIVGDIHGCNEEFEELLDRVHSETPTKKPDKCLKILVGDLVNKGPGSKKVLKICQEKYPNSILAVKGNHEEIVLALRKRGHLSDKDSWIEKLPEKYIAYMNALPYTIKIPSLEIIVVHGGLDPSREDPAVTTPPFTMTTMRNIKVLKDARSEDHSYLCTKSEGEGAAWATFWPGPDHVYFGHDARRRLQDQHEFATGLDTGCVYGDRLSYVYVKGQRKGEICSIKAKKAYQGLESDS